MLSLISLIIFVLAVGVACKIKHNTFGKVLGFIGLVLLASMAFSGILAGVVMPSGGYEESVVEEVYEITPCTIYDEEVYVIEVDGNYVCFKNVVVISNEGKITVPDAQHMSNVEIVEDEECEIPRIEKHVEEARSPFWTLMKMPTRVTYVIYVPVGTVFEDQ